MSPSATHNDPIENTALEPIAICGMACRLPGGVDSDSSFWKMLVEKRNGQTPKVPASRFNIDAHLHENLDRPGSFNVAGGYFLDGSPEDFDPGFFNMTPIEAQWLDPQQRKMLEVSYECLVSAGLTLEQVAGSNTAVFVGSFTSDYQQMSIRDPDFRHNYAATGVDTGIISNRIGNTFNLNGPSFTINTACSSSVYAIHNACHALRARDCDAAIAGGVNLIITVDQHMNTAKLGILSPTSTCHTFDASADGYGRAEGAGALYLKRLSDAVRDGNPIRGVIRSTAVNTNGKVDGMGITHPSVAGQERVVRMAYQKANLNPRLTAYAELHGTGTPVGDPIEVRAISRALNDERSKDKPLLIGAVKPNIGHSEAASGIFAVMKAALMTEAATIPGVAFFERLNPEIKESDWNVKIHANTAPWPKDFSVRRASVSSFGYGGTNGHVIVESIDSLYPWYRHAKAKKEATYDHSSKRPFLLTVSAHDKPTLLRNAKALGSVASDYYAADLAYTLNLRRSHFSHRAFTILREGHEHEAFEESALYTGVTPKISGGVGFLFTGQGAQWLGMGRVALKEFPAFLDTIQSLDLVLSRLTPKPSFTIEELLSDPSVSQEKISDAEVTQPLCTAIQIALVDLFALWNITPLVSIGHSSGEIGAAYASGLVSAPEAIVAAFCRGRAVKEFSTAGSMLAVGLGASEVEEYLGSDTSKVCIACENSPSSVTLSGDAESISQLGADLTSKGIFARELKTGRAYHSPHMATVGVEYDEILRQSTLTLRAQDLDWRRPRTEMVSSVTGERITSNTLPSGYWSANLRQRVLFSTAVHRMATDDQFSQVVSMIEIGPHAALSGPFKQICMANKLDRFTYTPSLVRNKNDADQILSVAGSMYLSGYAVAFEEVNSDLQQGAINTRKPNTQYLLTDLPPYQWNYGKKYWAEPRGSAEQRGRVYDRHDLLGSRVSGLSDASKIWRNILRQRDVPWLKDHTLGGSAIFPAAGHLSLAIEALRQVHETDGLPFSGVSIRDVDIKTALVIPESDGVEVVICLQSIDASDWHTFTVESIEDGKWSLHTTGKISAVQNGVSFGPHPVAKTALSQKVSGKRWYDAFHRVGFTYTNTFQRLLEARTDKSVHHAAGDVAVLAESGIMQGESRYMIHPSTIDACLQLIIISIHSGKHKEMPWGVVPTRIEEVTMTFPEDDAGLTGQAVAWTDGFEGRRFNTHTQLSGKSGKPLLSITGLTCISYEAALPAATGEAVGAPEMFSVSTWKPDIATLTGSEYLVDPSSSHSESVKTLLELIRHRQTVKNAVIYGSPSNETIATVVDALASGSAITVGFSGQQEVDLSDDVLTQVTVQTLPVSPRDWAVEAGNDIFDLVLVDFTGLPEANPDLDMTEVSALVKPGGWLIGALTDSPTALAVTARSSHHFSSLLPQKETAKGLIDDITVLSVPTPTFFCESLSKTWSSLGQTFHAKSIAEFQASSDRHIVIDDTTNTLFNTISEEGYLTLRAVLTSGHPIVWLTRGVNQGRSPAGGMAEGFLRVIRSEQAASRIALLDFSFGEKSLDLAEAITAMFNSVNTKDSGDDTEFWLHEGVLRIPRVYPRKDLNDKWNPTYTENIPQETLSSGTPLTAALGESGVVFEQEALPATLEDSEVEIQVHASEVILGAKSQILVAGTILRAGPTLDKTVVGKQAVALVNAGLHTIVRTSLFVPVDDGFGAPESLVGSLVPLQGLAHGYSTHLAGRVDHKSRVISLPGPKPITALTVLLAKSLGWDFTIIVKSEEEKKMYLSRYSLNDDNAFVLSDTGALLSLINQSSQNSSLSIIAHDFSTLAQEVWRNIPGASQFLLLSNEATLPHAPDGLPFTRGASFIPVNAKVLRASSEVAMRILKSSLDLLKAHPKLLSNFSDYTKVLDSTASGDFNTEVQNETLVMKFNYGEDQAKILPKAPELSLSADGTYLLVGCLGGLGRSLTKWMMERGARHFAFLSRSGADKPEAAQVVKDIEEKGASTTVFRTDAANEDEVARIVLLLQEQRPIRGVVHAAMVLKDGMFEQMDYYSFGAAIIPKAKGAISLHNALKGIDLDFFVMTSSISAVLGNTGQSNYSSANSFLDSLALHRNVNGLAASSLVLPMVLDVGVVAENDSIEQSLLRKGLYGINEQEMLRGFEVAMSAPHPAASLEPSTKVITNSMTSQLIMGMEASELAKSINSIGIDNADLYWFNDARFIHVREALEGSTGNSGNNGGDENFSTVVKAALGQGIDAAVEAIAMYVVKRMSGILMIPIEQFELNGRSLASYGLDSMIGAEMRTWLFKEFGLDYPFQKLLAPTLTFINLATVIGGKMGFIKVTEL